MKNCYIFYSKNFSDKFVSIFSKDDKLNIKEYDNITDAYDYIIKEIGKDNLITIGVLKIVDILIYKVYS